MRKAGLFAGIRLLGKATPPLTVFIRSSPSDKNMEDIPFPVFIFICIIGALFVLAFLCLAIAYLVPHKAKRKNRPQQDVEMGFLQDVETNDSDVSPQHKKTDDNEGSTKFPVHITGFDAPAVPEGDLGLAKQISMNVGKMETADGRTFVGVTSTPPKPAHTSTKPARTPSPLDSMRLDSPYGSMPLDSPYSEEGSTLRMPSPSRWVSSNRTAIRGPTSSLDMAASSKSHRHTLDSPDGLENVELEQKK